MSWFWIAVIGLVLLGVGCMLAGCLILRARDRANPDGPLGDLGAAGTPDPVHTAKSADGAWVDL